MSRRDLIIIAVLVNAGLLIVLFTSALKSSGKQEELTTQFQSENTQIGSHEMQGMQVSQDAQVSQTTGDEVDGVLRQYSNTQLVNTPVVTSAPAFESSIQSQQMSPSLASSMQQTEGVSNFAADLQSISVPSGSDVSTAITTPENKPRAASIVEVKVKKGDVLEKIAKQHHSTVDEIMKLNQLSSTNLKIGQVLKVAPKEGKKATSAVADAAPKLYTVKNGDNPWTIAVKNHMKVEELLKLNHLDEEKARRLKPGDQLRIR